MTGIERLRDIVDDGPYSGGMIHISVQRLREICEQIEREADDETVKREAIRAADNRRVELCAALGIDTDTGWSDAMAEMVKRLMPEGMEWLLEVWPKWSNGEYCRFGDWWVSDNYGEPKPKQFRKLSIYTPEQLAEWGQGDGESYGYEWDFLRPSDPKYRPDKVEPPAPPVLAADGEPLREGETVYVNVDRPYDACILTGDAVTVVEAYEKNNAVVKDEKDANWFIDADQLTHERPESKCRDCAHWQKDPTADNMGVCWFFYHEHEGQDCYAARLGECGACEEFVRRAKKLAGDA